MVFPPFCRPGILLAHLKGKAPVDRVAYLDPFQPVEEFDALLPCLAAMGVSETQTGRLLQKGLVSDSLLPSLCGGKAKADEVMKAVTEVLSCWGGKPLDTLGPLLLVAVEEVVTICRAVQALLDTNSANELAIAAVSEVSEAKLGLKMIVSKAWSF